MMRGMVIDMNDKQLATLAQLQAFLEGTTAVDFVVAADERYEFIARTVQRFGYRRLPRAGKGVVLRFLERVSGYSRQQLTRLVKRGAERRPLTKRLAHQFWAYLHRRRRAPAGPYRCLAQHAVGLGDQEAHGARLRHLWRCPLPAPGRDLGGASV